MATDVQTNLINETAVTAGGNASRTSGGCLAVGRLGVEVTPSATLSTGVLLTVEVSVDATNWTQIAVVRTGIASGETYGYEFDVSGWEDVKLTYGTSSSNIAIRADISGITP